MASSKGKGKEDLQLPAMQGVRTGSQTGATRTVQPLAQGPWENSLLGRTSTEGTPTPEVLSTECFIFHRGATLTNNTVMKRISKLLPALALVFGATLAMAMNFANNPQERYAEDPATGPQIWYDLTDVDPGPETYECNESVSVTCSFEEPSMTSDQVEDGQFIKNGNLPIVEP